jgi:solute carrier family 45 protein 1/2/4
MDQEHWYHLEELVWESGSLYIRTRGRGRDKGRDCVDVPSDLGSGWRASMFIRLAIAACIIFRLTYLCSLSQLAWCLEFGYGTPYLLSLGLSKASTSLVWVAAPVSGLMQPIVGVLSDLSTSQYRRRKYILAALIALTTSTLILAFSHPLSSALVDIFHTGLADWDPARKEALTAINKFVAVVSFVILDLSINSLQAASRALILDTAPPSQHSKANAWHGRMTHAGNVVGYAAGWCNLSSSVVLSWLGGDQFRKYAVVSIIGLITCTLITCVSIKEQAREPIEGSASVGFIARMKEATYHIWQSLRRLPRAIRRICLVQLFAFMGWFPFLFYSSQWIIEVHQKQVNSPTSGKVDDEAAEKGSFALL